MSKKYNCDITNEELLTLLFGIGSQAGEGTGVVDPIVIPAIPTGIELSWYESPLTIPTNIQLQQVPLPTINVESVSLVPTTHDFVLLADWIQLTETVLPVDASDKTGLWTSDDEGVATVSTSGLVTSVGDGIATITFTTTDGAFTATCATTVESTWGDELFDLDTATVQNGATQVGQTVDLTGVAGSTIYLQQSFDLDPWREYKVDFTVSGLTEGGTYVLRPFDAFAEHGLADTNDDFSFIETGDLTYGLMLRTSAVVSNTLVVSNISLRESLATEFYGPELFDITGITELPGVTKVGETFVCDGVGSADNIFNQIATGTIGLTYKIEYTVSNITVGGAYVFRPYADAGNIVTTNATYVGEAVCTTAGFILRAQTASGFSGTISNLSMKERIFYGPEIMTNGDFADGNTGWQPVGTTDATLGVGDVDGVTSPTSMLFQTGRCVNGIDYRLQLDVTNFALTGGNCDVINSDGGVITTILADGPIDVTFTHSSVSESILFRARNGAYMTIDNVSLTQVL